MLGSNTHWTFAPRLCKTHGRKHRLRLSLGAWQVFATVNLCIFHWLLPIGVRLGFYWDNGKYNGNDCNINGALLGTSNREPQEYSRYIIGIYLPGSLYSIIFLLNSWGSLFGVPSRVPLNIGGCKPSNMPNTITSFALCSSLDPAATEGLGNFARGERYYSPNPLDLYIRTPEPYRAL